LTKVEADAFHSNGRATDVDNLDVSELHVKSRDLRRQARWRPVAPSGLWALVKDAVLVEYRWPQSHLKSWPAEPE
jgi:hypothetical protein